MLKGRMKSICKQQDISATALETAWVNRVVRRWIEDSLRKGQTLQLTLVFFPAAFGDDFGDCEGRRPLFSFDPSSFQLQHTVQFSFVLTDVS